MPVRKKRPIYTRVGKIKPLGKSRMVKKAKPRPWRPFKITSYRLKERLPRVEGLIIHRRPSGRPDIALDPRELRAVPQTATLRGTLPERIFYKELRKRRLSPDRDFDFQSSLLGGRLQLGGIVADFLFQHWRLIVRIQGPTHKTRVQILKDQQQAQLLADMGWTVYDLPDEIVYDMMALETWMRRHIDRHPSLGGQQVIGQTVFLATGEMNFAWTAQESARVAILEDAVENLVGDMGRIESKAVVTINGLSDINSNLGLVQSGEFRVGNNKPPGGGYSGVRIGWPAFIYESDEWHIAGVNNDELQFGLRASDGKAVFGGGNVFLDSTGIRLVKGYAAANSIRWITGSGGTTVGRMFTYTVGSSPNRYGLTVIRGEPETGAAAGNYGWVELYSIDHDGAGDDITRAKIQVANDLWLHANTSAGVAANVVHISDAETVLNEGGHDVDFRWESASGTHAFFGRGSDGFIGIGTEAPRWDVNLARQSQNLVLAADVFASSSSVRPLFLLAHAGGTKDSPTITLADYPLGDFFWQGYNGTDFVGGATISAYATENFGAAARGSRLALSTVLDGNTALVERIGINQTETVFNESGIDLNFRVESDGNQSMFLVDAGTNTVGVGVSATNIQAGAKLHVFVSDTGVIAEGAADIVVLEQAANAGMTILASNTTYSSVYFGDGDDADVGYFRYSHSSDIFIWRVGAALEMKLSNTALYPNVASGLSLGTAGAYWNEINYKTLTDRGCLGWYEDGVELQDGSIVSDVEALKAIKKHPTHLTVAGAPRLDYSTMPKHVYRPVPIAEEDTYEKNDETEEMELTFKKGEKMGEDGAETTALISIMLGAIKELDVRLEAVEH